MSVKVMSHVWEHSKQKGSKLLMLLAIADSANDAGFAWPSQATLAKKARMTKRNAQRLLDQLATTGEIVIFNRVSEAENEHHFSNVYQIALPGKHALPAEIRGLFKPRMSPGSDSGVIRGSDTHVTTGNDTGVTTGSDSGVTTVVTPAPPDPSLEPSLLESSDRTSSIEAAAADDFNIFSLYHETFGKLVSNGILADDLKDIAATYQPNDIRDAFKETARANASSINYTVAILKRWQKEGRDKPAPSTTRSAPKPAVSPDDERLKALKTEILATLPDVPPDTYLPDRSPDERQKSWRMAGRIGTAKRMAEARLEQEKQTA